MRTRFILIASMLLSLAVMAQASSQPEVSTRHQSTATMFRLSDPVPFSDHKSNRAGEPEPVCDWQVDANCHCQYGPDPNGGCRNPHFSDSSKLPVSTPISESTTAELIERDRANREWAPACDIPLNNCDCPDADRDGHCDIP